METRLSPGPRWGNVSVPSSKSQCHRLFIMASLGRDAKRIHCGEISGDIQASISCLRALGAAIFPEGEGIYSVSPIIAPPPKAELFCGESGSTLRFLLPLAGLFGTEALFHMEGRLAERPLSEFEAVLSENGMEFEHRKSELYCRGKLSPGSFFLPGNISSQYISALLMSLPLLNSASRLSIQSELQSRPYVEMTEQVLAAAGIHFEKSADTYIIPGCQRPALPGEIFPEGDFSSAAFFLCAGAVSEKGISVSGLNPDSIQGDRAVTEILKSIGADVNIKSNTITVKKNKLSCCDIDAAQIPDLIPALAALLSLCSGESRIYNAARLRLKESDRLSTCCKMLSALGAQIRELPDGLIISGRPFLRGGSCESFNDHRIAMAASIAACGCKNDVIIHNSQAVEKSYSRFWQDFSSLKGE